MEYINETYSKSFFKYNKFPPFIAIGVLMVKTSSRKMFRFLDFLDLINYIYFIAHILLSV